MFGLKNLSNSRIAASLLAVSAALMVCAVAAPEDGSVATLTAWLVSALVLLGVWALMLVEALRRYFGTC